MIMKKTSVLSNTSPTMFALDIGTRSVVGMLGHMEDQKLVVEHAVVVYHETRAMFDGQIHDIDKVAKVIKQVKEQLEEVTGHPLSEVTIAAAGRALKTAQIEADLKLDEMLPISQSHIYQVELEALEKAQDVIHQEIREETRYFCVGHSVVHYLLDGALLTNPLGHHGTHLSVNLIATFLPKMVVDSLYTAVSKADLEVVYMTLEPIAAIEVAVPENARLLNIALVDVGAGTSDLAITKDGTMIAYGMSSVAGDEITELLAKTEMMDFDQAEKLKCQISSQDQLQYMDIFGMEHESSSLDLLEKLKPAIDMVAEEIQKSILENNSRKPSAVFLIGGGSQIPGLPAALSHRLDLPPERVAVRSVHQIAGIEYRAAVNLGPEGVTPIGILKKALVSKQNDFLEVEVNGQWVKLFYTRTLHVKDALAAIQFEPQHLVPRRGEGLTIQINGEPATFYGEYGEAAAIYVNSTLATIATELHPGDKVFVKKATVGKKRTLTLKEILPDHHLVLDDQRIPLIVNIKVNSMPMENVYMTLQHGDLVEYETLDTLNDVWLHRGFEWPIESICDNSGKVLTGNIKINPKEQYHKLEQPDTEDPQEAQAVESIDTDHSITIQYNGNAFSFKTDKKEFIFVDLFDHIDFDRSDVKGKLVLVHNGQPAVYTAPVKPGDDIWIYWDQETLNAVEEKREQVYGKERT